MGDKRFLMTPLRLDGTKYSISTLEKWVMADICKVTWCGLLERENNNHTGLVCEILYLHVLFK